MMKNIQLAVFENKEIRKIWHNEINVLLMLLEF